MAATFLPLSETPSSMSGRVCVVTGGTRGLGRAIAAGLRRLGASVVIVARDARRGAAVVDELQREPASSPGEVALVVADLASMAELCRGAAEIRARWPEVDVLVNNAGVSLSRRRDSPDGIESTLAVNLLAPILLTQLLQPALSRGTERPSRVINVSSHFARWAWLRLGDPQMTRGYNGTLAYLQSKLALLAGTLDLAKRFDTAGITVNAVYPRLAATELLRDRWWWRAAPLRPVWRVAFASAAVSAGPIVRLATDPAFATRSAVIFDARLEAVEAPRQIRDPQVRARLASLTAELLARAPCAGELGRL